MLAEGPSPSSFPFKTRRSPAKRSVNVFDLHLTSSGSRFGSSVQPSRGIPYEVHNGPESAGEKRSDECVDPSRRSVHLPKHWELVVFSLEYHDSTLTRRVPPALVPTLSILPQIRTVLLMSECLYRNRMFAVVWIVSAALWGGATAQAEDDGKIDKGNSQPQAYDPPIAKASDEGIKAIRSFRVPGGLKAELFAAEPLLANPVAFCVDEKGVVYVAETFRHGDGVTDTRSHMEWLDDDLASRSVADRVAMYKKYLGSKFESFHVQHERVRRVVDRDGDGRADASTVFADGFNDPAAGIGAGVLARKGDVYYTCIPGLWKLRDTRGDGRADERKLLHDGYGVHVGFLGHDLHGLKFGPDGRIYFSIGDRGFNVKTFDGKTLAVPDTGSVLRCNPDGTELEVFATGLRNPQELAFDQFGNLFTGDNNSDSGDRARWVYLVEGGDSGWRIGYQFLETPYTRGPWNEEKLWYPSFAGQAAYIVPPIAQPRRSV